jgi:predicted RNase H-like nuclease (RuvC/YqgF family)
MTPKKMTQAKFLAKLEEDIKSLLGRIESLEGEKEDLKKRVDGLEERLEKTLKEEIRKEGDSYAEKLKRNLVTTSGEVIMKAVTDLQERKYNVVFRDIKESVSLLDAPEDHIVLPFLHVSDPLHDDLPKMT